MNVSGLQTAPETNSMKREKGVDSEETDSLNPEAKRARFGFEEMNALEVGGRVKASISAKKGHEENNSKDKKGKKNNGKDGGGREWVSRRRRGTRRDGADEGADGVASANVEGEGEKDKEPRLPKRQCALLIGFCGSGFKGMQIQTEARTIEGVLFKALVAAGAVSKDNADDPVKVGLQRAARTDAGVHAAGNAVSLKMITNVPGVPNLVTRINEELPSEIRLWSFQRVQNSFNARLSCDSRKYTYFFPSYLLIPPKPTSAFFQSFARQSSQTSSAANIEIQLDFFWRDVNLETSREVDMLRKKAWRASKEKVKALREAARHFEGTHNFHNFTVGRDIKDRSCMRHMKKIEVADPVVYGETEWISVMLHGQSFMLHQRKMMCVLITSVRTGTPSSIIDALYGSLTVSIPKMPSLGLLLEYPIFESYSKRVESANEQKKLGPDDADYRQGIDFERHVDAMQSFKEEHIYSRMRESEEKIQVFDRWQNIFDRYGGQDLLYYNAQGTIPDAAVIKKGESRPNPFRERKRFDATEFPSDAPATLLVEDEAEDDVEVEEKLGKKELEEREG